MTSEVSMDVYPARACKVLARTVRENILPKTVSSMNVSKID